MALVGRIISNWPAAPTIIAGYEPTIIAMTIGDDFRKGREGKVSPSEPT